MMIHVFSLEGMVFRLYIVYILYYIVGLHGGVVKVYANHDTHVAQFARKESWGHCGLAEQQ